jgi:putative transferase (TIGR04331 family)
MIRPLIKFNKNKQKDLLTMILPNYSIFSNHMLSRAPSSYPCHTEAYFKIIDNLDNTIKSKNLLIRVLARDKGMSVQSVFENKYPNIKIDSQKTSLSEMLSNTRIFLSPYSGTGFLETLALNIPTIVSESTNRNNLFRKNANKYYEILKEAKIYFDDQELLAKHINSIWNNHQEWWDSDKVQKAKNIFCNEFAYINKNKVNELKEILINKHD